LSLASSFFQLASASTTRIQQLLGESLIVSFQFTLLLGTATTGRNQEQRLGQSIDFGSAATTGRIQDQRLGKSIDFHISFSFLFLGTVTTTDRFQGQHLGKSIDCLIPFSFLAAWYHYPLLLPVDFNNNVSASSISVLDW
jgi:hypothetical protein